MKIGRTPKKIKSMKKWYFLSAFLLSISFLNAQHINYDISSKWFFGLNAGAAWNTTDVKNVTSSGYGLILGRSYNYDYGKKISFDLRGRFLTGTWVGQDTSAISLANYPGGILAPYYVDSSSIYVNNFQTDVKRLSLELVLHMNGVRERTGLDPYVFGGIGLTWTQTYGDLFSTMDSSSIYDYSSMFQNGPIASQLSSNLDGIAETRLDGLTGNQYHVKWMPSLGFGLGYSFGKRASIGIEHKTTFTRGDVFDGYVSASPRLKNDLYHYTSVYWKLYFKARGDRYSTENNTSNVNNYTTTTNCPKPVLTLVSGNNKTVTNSAYHIEFKVSNLLAASGATLLNDLNQPVLFNYNASTQTIDAQVQLHNGQNTFYLSASNNCGSESATVYVTLLNCVTPTATFTNPNGNSMTVKTSDFTFSALIQGSVNANNIKLTMNGMALNGAIYNTTNGLLQRVITLIPGVNTIQLTVSNDCGSNTYTATITYDNCVPSSIQILNPSTSGTTTSSANFTLSANITGSLSTAAVKVFHNGLQLANPTVGTNGQLQVPVTLTAGMNSFNVEVMNGCGNDVEITNIYYQNCTAPVITVQTPSQNQTITTSTNAIRLNAIVSNITTKQNIKVIFNGIEQNNFTFNSATGAIDLGLMLANGNNSLTITATNNCGSDVETISFNYTNCNGVTPVLSLLSNGGSTNIPVYTLLASTNNLGNGQTISVTQNGSPIPFNQTAGQISAVTTLIPGTNTFVVKTVTSACGTDSKTITITYNNCSAPQIILIQPSTTGGTTNIASLQFKASATNILQSQNIQLVKNGQQIPFTFTNGLIEANISLTGGINTITLSVNNACGNDAETFTVNYVQCNPPTIQLTSSIPSGTTVTNVNYSFAATVTGVSSAQNMSLKVNGVTRPFNLQNGAVSASITLTPGLNTIIFNASNDCGLDVETISITYDNCVAPQITNASNVPTTVITNATQLITANISNVNTQNIVFTQNGIQRPFNFSNGNFNANVNLTSGTNSFVLSVSNNCGTDQHHWDMNYTPCTAPIVSITSPANSGLSVNAAQFAFQANVQNVSNTQGILLSLNGTTISNFTLTNGVISANLGLQNGLNTIVLKGTNACGTDIKTVTIFYSNCVAPIITVSAPSINAANVNMASFTYTANIQHVPTNQGIILTLNGVAITNYFYSNGQLSANVTLSPGVNTFHLSVSNACGSDMKNNSVTYLNCQTPNVTIVSPATNNVTVSNATYTFHATAPQMTSLQGISLLHNGNSVSNLVFANGQVSAVLALSPGINTFVLTATNACGTDSETRTIQYSACTAPTVAISNPVNTNYGVSNPVISFAANVSNMSSSQGISLTLNGTAITNFNYSNGQVTASITLSNGMNTISLSATNACGNDAQSRVIRYEPCNPPVVTITNPSSITLTANSNSLSFNGSVQNVTSGQGVSLTVNGTPVSTAQFNPTSGQVTATIPLSNGNNVVVLSAVGSCGTDSKTINVAYNPCVAPVVAITNPSSTSITVSANNYAFSANVQNATLSQINLSVNGTNVTNFNFLNGMISANLNLSNGNNEINVTVTNACGTDTKTVYIKYEPCLAPLVSILNPSTSSETVSNATYNYNAQILNIGSGQGINLTLNGNVIPNASFNNGQLSAILNLNNGQNTIVLSASNGCGTDSKTVNINFEQCVAPVVSIINPVDLFYGVNSPIFPFQATIQHMSSSQGISLTVAGNNVSNFNFTNGNFTATLNLPEGVDEIVLTATNACGTATQLRTIRYQSCIPPVIDITTDPSSGATVTSANLSFTAFITNYTPAVPVQFIFNGTEMSTYQNVSGAISANLSLSPGQNTVQINATSQCGNDSKTYTITYDDGSGSGSGGNGGNSDGMMQQNQPSQNKSNSPQPTPQNRPNQYNSAPANNRPAPVQTTPAQPRPVQTTPPPASPAPVQSQPTQPKPAQTPPPAKPAPVQSLPAQPKPVTTQPKPVQTPPPPAKPAPTQQGAGTKTTTPPPPPPTQTKPAAAPVQQSPQNQTNPTTPKGGTPQKGGGK
jgi:hypothetical protein